MCIVQHSHLNKMLYIVWGNWRCMFSNVRLVIAVLAQKFVKSKFSICGTNVFGCLKQLLNIVSRISTGLLSTFVLFPGFTRLDTDNNLYIHTGNWLGVVWPSAPIDWFQRTSEIYELQLEFQTQHGLMWLIYDNEKIVFCEANPHHSLPAIVSSVNKQILSDIYIYIL